jgi:ATP-dependent DNA helicase DinG
MTYTEPTTFAEAEAALAATLDHYEARPAQQSLAALIEEGLSTRRHVIAQAGTGTGKSLATLIPAITSGQRVVVSTATKALQDQVANKDLPFLREHLFPNLSYALLKGRSNYLCRAALAEAEATEPTEQLVSIRTRIDGGEPVAGERDDFEVDDATWRKVTVSSDQCAGSDCPFAKDGTCHSEQAKTKAQEARVVVTNHALLLTDAVISRVTGGKASLLGNYDAIIVDEAHELEEFATGALGRDFTEGTVLNLLAQIGNLVGDIRKLPAAAECRNLTLELFAALEDGRIRASHVIGANEDGEAIPVGQGEAIFALAQSLQSLRGELTQAKPNNLSKSEEARWRRVLTTLGNAATGFADVLVADWQQSVRWVTTEGEGRYERKVLHTAPVEVGELLASLLWDDHPTTLVSATLAMEANFDYFGSRVGVDAATALTLDVGTPFDYPTQALTFVPDDLPEPSNQTRAEWEAESILLIDKLVRASSGGALVLFTSRQRVEKAYELLASRLPFPVRKQGDASNQELATWLRTNTDSGVLFATRSFFTGVDVPGDNLRLVVIDKLPFPVPTDPIVEARSEAVEFRGGNSFRDYTVPVMTLPLQQAYGRLVRHTADRGVVAILDPRLATKPYGRRILRSLPNAPLTHSLTDVQDFYTALRAA